MIADIEYYARLQRYDSWADRATWRSLEQTAPPKARRWMAHIIGASTLWLARLKREEAPLTVWPDLELDECGAWLDRLDEAWPPYLETLSAADLEAGVDYRNSLGETWTSRVEDILTHLALHGAYHRAQIAAAVRESGGEPAYTDFIHAVRRRLVV